ncbi:hypothetical protein DOTSEDRAFT_67909 [Dothistroma septosporum NZE10]|uniref:Protein EFR3 n=1 Tax=Dothistroma septosporum (strain NZE10 / CBS 128990) TaxID=675120 RepID=N1Q021_DOTSN|nr:hypothetical protein DOTSEDRAFT_67909 [Dothistroma septosporum NZE10]
MPTTHLPGHLDSLRQKARPKHQLLVLKCYPRLPKNSTADVKPNSSELSYLLYYASTRQDKIPKVGTFLEQKTAHDVGRYQSTRVLVTLQILTALLEHKEISRASGFALIAPSVLRVLRDIINNTNDVSLIEATTPTWDVFCQHQDVANLAADLEYRTLYEEVVRLYGSLAKNNSQKLGKSTQPVAHHDAIRLRKAGVEAIRSVFGQSELNRNWNREYNVAIAAVLTNLRHDLEHKGGTPEYLDHLVALSTKNEEEERPPINHRQSIATVRTFSGLPDEQDPDPRAAEGTAQDADRLEEEEVGLLALDCIKAIFQSQNRAQIRDGAIAFMRHVADEAERYSSTDAVNDLQLWAATLFRLITLWTPVQDRFIPLFTANETLTRYPLEKSQDFRVASIYAKCILGVLRSDMNLIGLSVIDMLLGLINQTIRLAAAVAPRHDLRSDQQVAGGLEWTSTAISHQEARRELLPCLKDCIANLARHVYYADQVTDMISFIMLRVKANTSASDKDTAVAADRVTGDTSSALTRDKPASVIGGGFSSESGRHTALEIVKNIIEIAQSTRQYSAGSTTINRHAVPLGVWEGSQWLAKDSSELVRETYREALLAWAKYEADDGDAALIDFEAVDCIERLADSKRPASLNGSTSQSHRSAHPQLLMLPKFGEERRMSSGKNSEGSEEKPRGRSNNLRDIIDGKVFVPPREMDGKPVDVKALMATVKVDRSRAGLTMEPPYH